MGKKNEANGLPLLILPGGEVSITESAGNLFKLIAAHETDVRFGAASW